MTTNNSKLITLYQQIADLTAPKCANSCRAPHSCCSPEYCEMAIELASEQGVTLSPTKHPTLPLMSSNGCIAAPHFRPLCSLHLCSISSLGFDPDPNFNKQYFQLRKQIDKQY